MTKTFIWQIKIRSLVNQNFFKSLKLTSLHFKTPNSQKHQPFKQCASEVHLWTILYQRAVFELEHFVKLSRAVAWVEGENEGARKVVDEGDGAEVSVLGIFQGNLTVVIVVRACNGLNLFFIHPHFSCFQPVACGKMFCTIGKCGMCLSFGLKNFKCDFFMIVCTTKFWFFFSWEF